MYIVTMIAVAVGTLLWLAEPTVQPSLGQKGGWMRGGWGNYALTLTAGAEPLTVVAWSVRWTGPDGKAIPGHLWGERPMADVRAGETWRTEEIGMLPEDVSDRTKGRSEMRGTVTVRIGEATRELPFRLAVPTSVLPEPTVTRSGQRVAVELMRKRWSGWRTADATVALMDRVYDRMEELVGVRPYDGRTITLAESPPHFAWAYAGERVILNTDYVGETLANWDRGVVSFGWIHELGHTFDVADAWTIPNGAWSEAMANIKAAYVFEKMPALKIEYHTGSPAYAPGASEKKIRPAAEWSRAFLLTYGDAYLADASRGWDDMGSDDVCSLLLRIREVYGWAPLRRLFREASRLKGGPIPAPADPQERTVFVCAALSAGAGVDLTSTFRLWRAPITSAEVAEATRRYGL